MKRYSAVTTTDVDTIF